MLHLKIDFIIYLKYKYILGVVSGGNCIRNLVQMEMQRIASSLEVWPAVSYRGTNRLHREMQSRASSLRGITPLKECLLEDLCPFQWTF